MSISEVRTYLKNRITDEESSFQEHTDGFSTDNIPVKTKNKVFFIEYQQPSNISFENSLLHDSVSATVKLFFRGFRNPQEVIDSSMDTAYNIKKRAMNMENYTGVISRVLGTSVTIEPTTSNDNDCIISMSFDIELFSEVI